MARSRVFCASLLLFAAWVPSQAQERVPEPAQDPGRFLEAYFAAWSSGDVERILAFFTDDVVYEDVPNVDNGWATPSRGKEEMRDALVGMYAAMPDMAFEDGPFSTGEDRIVVEWTMTGTHTGDWPGLPATGRSIEVRGVSVMELEDGKIARNRDYYDMYLFLNQLGAVPALGE